MLACPRDIFVPAGHREEAFVDGPIRVAEHGFNISAPHMHATMLEALDIVPGDRHVDLTSCLPFRKRVYRACLLASTLLLCHAGGHFHQAGHQLRRTPIDAGFWTLDAAVATSLLVRLTWCVISYAVFNSPTVLHARLRRDVIRDYECTMLTN